MEWKEKADSIGIKRSILSYSRSLVVFAWS